MYTLLISILAGVMVCVAYWVDHTMVRAETEYIPTDTLWKLFGVGFLVAYGVSMIASSSTEGFVEPVVVADTLRTGQPSF